MSVDYTRTEGEPTPDSESSMFAPTPLWDRKAKGRGARRNMFRGQPEETGATSAAMTGAAGGVAADRVMTDDATRETAMSPNGDDAFVASPTRRTTVRRDRSMAPAAVVVGLVAIAALAAAGWYATRPGDTVLTPGGPNAAPATSVAAAPPAASAGGANLAANTPPAQAAAPAATHTATTRATHTTTQMASAAPVTRRHTTRTTVTATPERPVVARSATGAGVNTGAAVPVLPVPPAATVSQTPAGAVPSVPQTAAPPPAVGPTTAVTPPVSATPTTPSPTPSTATPTPGVTSPTTSTAPSPSPGSGTPQ